MALLDPSRHVEFEWEYEAQQYRHKPCDCLCLGNSRVCPQCLTPTPANFTWADVLEFCSEEGMGDTSDYFSVTGHYEEPPIERNHQVWKWQTWRVACFWVEGSSEGYYVHVEVIDRDSRTLRPVLVGKTLFENEPGKRWAEQCVAKLQRFINSNGRDRGAPLDREFLSEEKVAQFYGEEAAS